MSVYFYGCMTIDGYLADKNHKLDWLYQSGTVDETNYDEFYQKMDIAVMGKKTFDEVAAMEGIGEVYPSTVNYVFTHTKELSLKGFIPVSGDVAAFVEEIEKDKNIWIIGGGQILAPLLERDMVDEMVIQIAPVLLGEGIKLFTQKGALKRFSLQGMNRYGQFAELIYTK